MKTAERPLVSRQHVEKGLLALHGAGPKVVRILHGTLTEQDPPLREA